VQDLLGGQIGSRNYLLFIIVNNSDLSRVMSSFSTKIMRVIAENASTKQTLNATESIDPANVKKRIIANEADAMILIIQLIFAFKDRVLMVNA
jgi:hypothetical protein